MYIYIISIYKHIKRHIKLYNIHSNLYIPVSNTSNLGKIWAPILFKIKLTRKKKQINNYFLFCILQISTLKILIFFIGHVHDFLLL